MTTQAPPQHLDRTGTLPAQEQPTFTIEAGSDEAILDSLPLLVPRFAPRGRRIGPLVTQSVEAR
jgi:hypothetical protein